MWEEWRLREPVLHNTTAMFACCFRNHWDAFRRFRLDLFSGSPRPGLHGLHVVGVMVLKS